jgi:uncharacterized protein YndB with AHSA1/START domain
MTAHERSLETTAPPERVWRIWSDTSTWPDWNPDMESVTLAGPFASGTQGTMRTRSGGQHSIVLEDVEPPRGFTVNSDGMPATRLRFRCEVAPAAAGSRISQSVTMAGPLSWLFSPMAGGRIADTFPPLLRGLASEAEKQAG